VLTLICWLDPGCLLEKLKEILNWAAEQLMKLIFAPVIEAIAAALRQILTTMATFWVNVDTPRPGAGPAGTTIDWLQDRLLYFVFVAATISLIIAGMRMAWEHRGEPAREVLKSLLTLVVVMGLATAVVGGLSVAGDRFSTCVINSSITPGLPDNPQPSDTVRLDPPPPGGDFTEASCNRTPVSGADFGRNVMLMLFAVTVHDAVSGSPMGIIMVITMGVLAIIAALLQVMLMIVRNGMLVLLMGVLPLAAAATNTETGKAWFRRCITWLTAFLLYKPVAALVYAAALRLASTDPLRPALSGNAQKAAEAIVSAVTGFVMMVLALFALPALMRFLTPLVAATAGANLMPAWVGGVGGWAASKMAQSSTKGADPGPSDGPAGARNVPQTTGSSTGASGAQGAQGATGATGASGASGTAGAAGSAAATAGSAAAGAATAGVATVAIEAAKAVKKTAETVKQGVDDAVQEGANPQAMDDGPRGSG
jgi:TrbL/VirB6 plasmid conjugal transfer protein